MSAGPGLFSHSLVVTQQLISDRKETNIVFYSILLLLVAVACSLYVNNHGDKSKRTDQLLEREKRFHDKAKVVNKCWLSHQTTGRYMQKADLNCLRTANITFFSTSVNHALFHNQLNWVREEHKPARCRCVATVTLRLTPWPWKTKVTEIF